MIILFQCQGWADGLIIQAIADKHNLKIHIIESNPNFTEFTVVQAVNSAVYNKVPYVPGYPFCYNVHSIEVTLIKIINFDKDNHSSGLDNPYCSPKVPVRQLCDALTELLNSFTTQQYYTCAWRFQH